MPPAGGAAPNTMLEEGEERSAPPTLQAREYKGVFLMTLGVLGAYALLFTLTFWPLIVGAYFWLWAVRNTLLQRGATRLNKVDGGVVSFLPQIGMGVYLAATSGCHAPVVSILAVALSVVPGLNFSLLLYGATSNFLAGRTFAQFCAGALNGASVPFGKGLLAYATLMTLFWLVGAPAVTIWRAIWQVGCPVPEPGTPPVHQEE